MGYSGHELPTFNSKITQLSGHVTFGALQAMRRLAAMSTASLVSMANRCSLPCTERASSPSSQPNLANQKHDGVQCTLESRIRTDCFNKSCKADVSGQKPHLAGEVRTRFVLASSFTCAVVVALQDIMGFILDGNFRSWDLQAGAHM